MKAAAILLFLCCCTTIFAQQQKFDLVSYTPPKGWKKQATEQTVQWLHEDSTKGTFCIIMIFKSLQSSANSKENFDAAWETVVKEAVTINTAPEMQPVATEDGWEVQSGYAPFESEGQKGVALLATSTGFGKLVNILMLTNSDVYETQIANFLESVIIAKPADAANNNAAEKSATQPSTKTVKDGFTFSSTNFDDGWVSTIHNDWVLVTKGDIKVYLWYALQYDYNKFSGTGIVDRDYYWDNYVSKYFTIQTKQYKDGGEVIGSLKPAYVEGWAIDKETGQKRFIGMRLDISPNTAKIVIGSAKDESTLWQQFPKANGGAYSTSDLSNMNGYNKFALTANDILGTWQDGNTSTMQWYYTAGSANPGGYAGMTVAATSATFNFNTGGNYTSIHNGATGAVGNMSTFQQNYKGKYTVTNWNVTASNRWNGKTETFDASFEVIRGGRILHLNTPGIKYSLVKAK